MRNMIRDHRGQCTNLKLILAGYYLYKPGEDKGDLDSSSFFVQEVLRESSKENDRFRMNKAQFYACNIILERGDRDGAFKAFKKHAEACVAAGFFEAAADTYCRIGDLHGLTQAEEKLKNYRLSESYYYKGKLPEEAIQIHHAIGDVYFSTGKLDSAEKTLLDVINWYKVNNYQNRQDTYFLLSEVNRYRGNFDKAISYALEAVKYAEMTESDKSFAYYFTVVAEIYSDMGNEKQSVTWFRKTMNLMHQDNSEFMYNNLKQLSDYLIMRGGAAEVLRLLNTYNQSARRTEVEKEITACIKGNAAFYNKNYKEAERYYLEMMYWEAKAKVHTYNSADSYHTIADFYLSQKAYEKARFYLDQILLMPKDTYPLSKIKDVYMGLYQADSAKNDLRSALVQYKHYTLLNDSILNQSQNKKIQELLIKYDADQKEKTNNLLRKESVIQNSRLQKADLITKITISGIGALLVIIALFYKQFKDRKKASEILITHQNEITAKNDSLLILITKQEKLLYEKEWLVKEIHHRVKNNLQLIMSLINSQVNYLDNDQAISALKDSQNRMHSISLIHQKLYQSDNVAYVDIRSYIVELMKFLCDTFHFTQRIKFEFKIPEIQFDITQSMPLGLIINEAMTNIIKYAFPNNEVGRVVIELKELTDDFFEFSISDNGGGLPKGFDYSKNRSLGMVLIKGLSEQIGGKLTVSSESGVKIQVLFKKSLLDETLKLYELNA